MKPERVGIIHNNNNNNGHLSFSAVSKSSQVRLWSDLDLK